MEELNKEERERREEISQKHSAILDRIESSLHFMEVHFMDRFLQARREKHDHDTDIYSAYCDNVMSLRGDIKELNRTESDLWEKYLPEEDEEN